MADGEDTGGGESKPSCGVTDAAGDGLEACVSACRKLYTEQKFSDCVTKLEQECLSDAAELKGASYLAELHLMLAKCYRGMEDYKSAVLSCNSAMENRPQWKDPYLVRSSCFQSWHSRLTESAGDSEENIERDRGEANIIVDASAKPSAVVDGPQTAARVVNRLDEAFQMATEGSRIFVEKGTYRVTSNPATSKIKSAFLFGKKNVSVIGASSKDCVLLYGHQADDEEAVAASLTQQAKLETMLICVTSPSRPTLIKRLTFKCSAPQSNPLDPSQPVRVRFLGVAGGSVQLEDCVFQGCPDASPEDKMPDVDAVYTSSMICGALADNYPPPSVAATFCVFDNCRSYGAFTVARGAAAVRNCLFLGRSGVTALDSAKIRAENSEFARGGGPGGDSGGGGTTSIGQTISAGASDLTVKGCYLHHQMHQVRIRRGGTPLRAIAFLTAKVFNRRSHILFILRSLIMVLKPF